MGDASNPISKGLVRIRTDDLIKELEPRLMAAVRQAYGKDYDFSSGSYGDELLQAGRIVLFQMMQSCDPMEIFEDPEKQRQFLALVRLETREQGRELHFLPKLSTLDEGFDIEQAVWEDNRHYRASDAGPDPSLLPNRDYHIATALGIGGEAWEVQAALGAIKTKLEDRPKYHRLRSAYGRAVAAVYEQVRTGEIPGWRTLGHQYFDWDVTLVETIRHVTDNHILPHYGCSLENLPIQKGLRETLFHFRLGYVQRNLSGGMRDFFIRGFPEMEDSVHWHPARWPRKGVELTAEQRRSYSVFLRKYIFEHRLGCRTRDDVIHALNNRELLREIIAQERLPMGHYHPDEFTHKSALFYMVSDLDGVLYDIDPWEIDAQMPKNWFFDGDGLNLAEVRKYLAWVVENYGIPSGVTADNPHIPHYHHMKRLGLSACDIRKLLPGQPDVWTVTERAPANTWVRGDGVVDHDNVRKYLRWLMDEYDVGVSTTFGILRRLPHFQGLYAITGRDLEAVRDILRTLT